MAGKKSKIILEYNNASEASDSAFVEIEQSIKGILGVYNIGHGRVDTRKAREYLDSLILTLEELDKNQEAIQRCIGKLERYIKKNSKSVLEALKVDQVEVARTCLAEANVFYPTIKKRMSKILKECSRNGQSEAIFADSLDLMHVIAQ